jgi:Protein of unknown function (DUF1523)
VAEAKDASGGSASGSKDAGGATPAGQGGEPRRRSFKSRMLTRLALLTLFLMVAFFMIRWVGTSTYRGKVQRVYEQGIEYRVEFTDLDGGVHVIGNTEIKFPYFKLDTADLHAHLNRLSTTGDIVDIRVWGFRQSWFSIFPNAIDVTFVRSDTEQQEARAGRITDEVLQALSAKGVLKGGDEVRPAVLDAVKRGMKVPGSEVDQLAPASQATPQ